MEAGKRTGKDVNDKENTGKLDAEKKAAARIGSLTGGNAKESIGKESTIKENIGEEGIAIEDTKKEVAEIEDIGKEDAGKESEEIDIYLFSNGQMYSPPRKHHLRTDELKYWEATLSFLARSHYGSLHSAVELYELDGRKVEDPKYIRDCAVYVAVVPPDPFIYAGYDKYIVKASKSYEKRLSKRANGAELLDPDNANKDSVNVSKQDQDSMPAKIPAGKSEIRPQYLNFRKNDIRKSSLKISSQKLTEKIKPVANQVSQRPNVPRKPNLKSSPVAKRLYNSQKDTPRNNSSKNTQPISEKISSIIKSINKSKSPVLPELLVCDHSSSKVNESRQQFVNSTSICKIINTKTQGINKVNTPTLRNTLKLINTNTKKNDYTRSVTKDSTTNDIFKESADHPKVIVNRIKPSSVKNLPKPIKYDQTSANNKKQTSRVDDKLQPTDKTQIPITNKTKQSTTDKIIRPPASQLSILTNTRASTVKPISDLHSDESTPITGTNNNNRTADVDNTDKDRMRTTTENKMATIEEIPILDNIDQVVMYRIDNSTEDQVPETITEIQLEVNNAAITKTKTSTVKKVTEPKYRERIGILNTTSTSKINETELPIQLESNILIPKEAPLSINKELILGTVKSAIQASERNHTQNPLSLEITTSDKIPELNDKDFTPVIIKVSEPDKQKKTVSNKTSYLPDLLMKATDVDPILLTNKILKVDMNPTATSVDGVAVKRDKEIDIKRSSSDDHMQTVVKQSIKDKFSSMPQNFYDIKVPMLNHAPEKTIRYISNNGTEVVQNKDAINDNALLSEKYVLSNSVDIKKNEGPDSNKRHSFTFIVKNDYNNNNAKVTDMKIYPRDSQKTVNVPISNMIKDKDFIHINIFRNPLNDTTLPIRDGPKTQPYNDDIANSNTDFMQKIPDNHDITLENKISVQNSNNSPENYQYSKIKEAEMTTTFVNPKWEGTSASIVNKLSAPSQEVISDNTETDTTQFIDLMQNGDIVNLKLSFQISDADGILKSTQTINMGKSNSVIKLDNGDIGKTPNKLTRSKSLQSAENDSPPHLCCRKDKVIVYQCACCTQSGSENTNYTLAANPLNSGLQGFYVLLPVAMPVTDSAKPPSHTLDKQVQHTESFIKTNVTGSYKETFITVPGDGDNQIKSSEKYDSPTIRQVAIMDEEIMHSQLIMMRTEPSQTSSRYKMDSKIQQTNTTTQNQSTQTDWCDVLLEARAEPDGRYTFYLPPLHLLQQYSLR